LNFLDRFSKNAQISNFKKIRSVTAKLFNADRRTDGHDEANSSFSQICEGAYIYQGNDTPAEKKHNTMH